MRLVEHVTILSKGNLTSGSEWERVLLDVRDGIDAVRWPPGDAMFTIYPESGKKAGMGNGVKPIKNGFVATLRDRGWKPEGSYPKRSEDGSDSLPGAFDVSVELAGGGYPPFVVEWETGNISSSHRAINKMTMGMLTGRISGGLLIVPTLNLAAYLTDRIGNLRELRPYFRLWQALPIRSGYLGIITVEHDEASYTELA